MTDYKPGTVAIATVRGVPNVRVMWDGEHSWWHPNTLGFVGSGDVEVTDIRPLVVLDLDESPFSRHPKNRVDPEGNPATPERWLRALVRTAYRENNPAAPNGQLALWLADQIEAQTKPPRIPEPGLWGVVSARPETGGEPGGLQPWVRTKKGWSNSYVVVAWDRLIDPVLIREGVEG